MFTHNYYPTKIANIPVKDFTKKELLILLNAAIWALSNNDNVYGGLICTHNDRLFDSLFLSDLEDVKGYHNLLSIIRSITIRLIFIG
jgi:hypothetical protein